MYYSQIILILDQLKNKLQLDVDDLDKFTVEELRQQVDQAVGQVNLNKWNWTDWTRNK